MTFEDKIEIDKKYGISHLFFDEKMSKEDYELMIETWLEQCRIIDKIKKNGYDF